MTMRIKRDNIPAAPVNPRVSSHLSGQGQNSHMFSGNKLSGWCIFLLLFIILSLEQCGTLRIKRELKQVSELTEKDTKSPYLKVHIKDGSVYLLDKWNVNEAEKILTGSGKLLDFNRNLVREGDFSINFSEISLCETNVPTISGTLLTMTILTVPSAMLSTYCIINPKACFGSCPTFYAWDGEKMSLQAEAFSSCIAPALEETDIDMLYKAQTRNGTFRLKVTNEALETHVIRSANLLAVPRTGTGRTFMSPAREFFITDEVIGPISATGPEGNCLSLMKAFDHKERFSSVSAKDLAEKEDIDFSFHTGSAKRYGIVIGFRQTLLTTYLLYQGIAYMGRNYGYWLSMLEREQETINYISGPGDLLGGIEIFVQDEEEKWIKVTSIYETGPIASDVWMVPLEKLWEKTDQPVKIKLRMSKGLWRIDYVALAGIIQPIEPVRLSPDVVLYQNSEDTGAKEKLLDREKTLVTLPGDSYTLIYLLPADSLNYDLFLESQGYYLEWMRPAWLLEENTDKTLEMFTDSKAFLKECAGIYKMLEPGMEEAFWGSKYEIQ